MDFTEGLKIFLWAMTPVGELRIAIPIGLMVYRLSPVLVYFFAVLGNLFAVFLILVFLGAFSRWTSNPPPFVSSQNTLIKFIRQAFCFICERWGVNRFFNWLFSRTRKNHHHKVNKYGLYVLPLFVAIPLPITGGWTASLIAFVFGIPFKKAFPLIGAGVLVAGLIVSFLTKTGIIIEKYFGWQIFVAIILITGIIYWLYKNNNKINQRG